MGMEFMRHRPASIWLLIDPAWPFDRENLPSLSHEPEHWPGEDPKLKNDTSPPDVLVVSVPVDPVIRHYRCCSMAHGVRDSNVPSIIRPAYGLGQAVGYGNALQLSASSGDLKPTFGQSNHPLSLMLGSKRGHPTPHLTYTPAHSPEQR